MLAFNLRCLLWPVYVARVKLRLNIFVRLFLGSSSAVTAPDAIQNRPIFEDPQQLVFSGDLVEISCFLVCKEKIRFPDGIQHGRIQV